MSFENERETVREELSRIDEMINSETVAEPVVPPEDDPCAPLIRMMKSRRSSPSARADRTAASMR